LRNGSSDIACRTNRTLVNISFEEEEEKQEQEEEEEEDLASIGLRLL